MSHDLPLYLPGIAPVLTFASLSVRPLFLSLIETHISDLEPWAVRPALKAILLALLPGLEEETSDDFEPTLRLVNKFRDAASRMNTHTAGAESEANGQYFWQSLFLASITSPSRRLGALAYLNRYLPKLGIADRRGSATDMNNPQELPQDMLAATYSVISPEPGLLIRCFASGLSDEQLLVQRNFLDLLVTHLPLNSPILQSRITEGDLEKLVIAAVGVVTRRDMSLNRRLWAWLLGPEPPSDPADRASFDASFKSSGDHLPPAMDNSQSQYFSRFGLKSLVNGLLRMIKQGSKVPSERARPFRISLSLMDRWEVGGFVVPAVFLPIIQSVEAFEKVASKSQFDEVFRSASAFFDGVESGVIFSEILNLVDWRLDHFEIDVDRISHDLKLANFILENFNVREEDMLLIHVPLLLLSALIKMSELFSAKEQSRKMHDRREVTSNALMAVMNSLIGLLTERAFMRKGNSDKTDVNDTSPTEIKSTDILKRIHNFYDQSKNSLDLPPLPFAPKHMGELILRESYELVISALESRDDTFAIQEKTNLLIALLKKLPKSRILRDRRLYSAICTRLEMNQVRPSSASFSVISSVTSAVTSLYFIQKPGYYISYEDISDLIPTLVGNLWQFLSPLSPKYHVEAVRCLWLLHSVTYLDHLVEASIASLMIGTSGTGSFHSSSGEQAERFFVLWNHSHHGLYEVPRKQINDSAGLAQFSYHSSMLERPLFIVLDLLSQVSSKACHDVQKWLQELSSIPR